MSEGIVVLGIVFIFIGLLGVAIWRHGERLDARLEWYQGKKTPRAIEYGRRVKERIETKRCR